MFRLYSKDKNDVSDGFAKKLEATTLVVSTIGIFGISICAVFNFITTFGTPEGAQGFLNLIGFLSAILGLLVFRWVIILFIRMYEYQKNTAVNLGRISANLETIAKIMGRSCSDDDKSDLDKTE